MPPSLAGTATRYAWLLNPGAQELPHSFCGLGRLGGAEHDRVHVRQPLADLEGDVDPGLGRLGRQPLGIAQQQIGRE
jgi:hypothetical protein